MLKSVGLWDEYYTGYGLEDDTMALKLFLNYGKPALLNDISVVHIWHQISPQNYRQMTKNKEIFNEKLRQLGIKTFHVGRLLYDEEKIIEYTDDID